MTSTTSVNTVIGEGSTLRRRTCAREACCSPQPSQENKCCDDDCLVEIARRDCHHGHDSSPSSLPQPSDEEPCESHLSKAKAAYSEMLANIGCVCRVLLSLGLESCCTKTPMTVQMNNSSRSLQIGLLGEMRRVSRDTASSKSISGGSCAGESCCPSAQQDEKGGVVSREEKNCSSNSRTGSGTAKTPAITRAGSCSTSACCIRPSKEVLGHSPSNGGKVIENLTADLTPSKTPTKSCCSGMAKEPTLITRPLHDSDQGCCSKEGVRRTASSLDVTGCSKGCCSTPTEKSRLASPPQGCKADEATYGLNRRKISAIDSDSACTTVSNLGETSEAIEPSCCLDKPKPANQCSRDGGVSPIQWVASTGQIDLEHGDAQSDHLILSIQGMTCTGCETNLFKSLTSMPGVSNVKTSLALARAEFDLLTNSTRSVVDTIRSLEKRTGFTCTRVTESGHELLLVVESSASYANDVDWPQGVSDIQIVDTQTIRVVYHPEQIGAREILRKSLFRSTNLAPMADPPLISAGRAQLWLMLFKTVVSAILTIPVLVMAWAQIPPRDIQYGAASLVLATVVQVYIAGPWYVSAFKALFFSHLIEVDFLVVLSSSTAYVYSIIAFAFLASGQPLSTEGFFETSTLLVTLIMLGRLVTTLARQRAVESISIESLQPSTALLLDPETKARNEIDARLLQYGDTFVVLPDFPITTDGTVVAGTSEVDESMITGEATLVAKNPGSPVIAGSINHTGVLTIRLTRLPGHNTIKAIGLMVDEAKSSKAKFQEIADRVAGFFVPVVLVLTVVTFAIWVGVGKGIRKYSTSKTCINAMTYAISALIVSCPCAIGLAVPMVLVIAGGVAAKHGVIFKTAETIEKARKISHVVFDKTGTLTHGVLTVADETYPTDNMAHFAPIILALTSSSRHPVSAAVAAHLISYGNSTTELRDVKTIPGCGTKATWGEDYVLAGNPYWLGVQNLPSVKRLLSLGLTVFCVTVNKGLVAVYGLRDSVRPDTKSALVELRSRGIEVSIVSGDNEESVKSVARLLEIPESHVRFRCSPEDKQAYVKSVSSIQKVVMFCGDGTNDAVALAEASIGMHVNGGTEIAKSAADAVLIRPSLTGIVTLIDLSRAFYRRVVFNFAWAFVYNTFAILLAAGAFPNVRIEPKYAGLGEIVSVLPVIAAGVQLRWAKFSKEE